MSLSMYRASIPVFVRALNVLSKLLEKAEAHAKAQGTDPAVLLGARLAPDMFPLAAQIQRASDTSKASAARLIGQNAPRFEDTETTFADLQERIAKTVKYLQGIDAAQLEGSQARTITLNFGPLKPTFSGEDYLIEFAIPNFFFHVTTAYAILRNLGVPVGKADYLGPYPGQTESQA